MCPSCICFIISVLIIRGIISLSPLKFSPSSANSSSLNCKYGFSTSFLVLNGWPPCLDGLLELLQHCVIPSGVLQLDQFLFRQHHVVTEHPLFRVVHRINITVNISFRVCVVSSAHRIGHIHLRSLLVPHFKWVLLQSHSHALQTFRCHMYFFLENTFKRFVVCFNVDCIPFVNVVVEFLTCEYHSQQFLLDLSDSFNVNSLSLHVNTRNGAVRSVNPFTNLPRYCTVHMRRRTPSTSVGIGMSSIVSAFFGSGFMPSVCQQTPHETDFM